MKDWPPRRWIVAMGSAVVVTLFVAVPTALIPSPIFGRSVPATWWAWPVLVLTACLSGLLTATYVTAPDEQPTAEATPSRTGLAGGFLTYLAVGCPACNKIALIALGATGAVRWFAPYQPLLALAGIGLLGYALRHRLSTQRSCPIPTST